MYKVVSTKIKLQTSTVLHIPTRSQPSLHNTYRSRRFPIMHLKLRNYQRRTFLCTCIW